MCDGENRGAAFLLHFLDLGLDALFGGVVQRGGGLVQYQDAGFFEEDAGQRDALALTAGEVGSPLGQHKLIAALQLLDVGGDVGLARRRDGQNQQNQKEAGLLFPGQQGEDAFPDFRAFA